MGYAKFEGDDNTPLRPNSPALTGQFAPLSTFSTAAQRAFRARLQAGVNPSVVTLLGDSTGNDATDWFRPVLASMASAHPEYTVQHRLWSDTNQFYDAPTYLQTGTAGMSYLTPGANTPQCTINDSDAVSVYQTDLMIRARIRVTNFSSGASQTIASHFGATGQRSWRLYISSTGFLTFGYSSDGTALVEVAIIGLAAAGFTAGTDFYIGVKFQRSNGSNVSIQAITSTDGATWTDVGAVNTTGTIIANLHNSTAQPEVGDAANFTGKLTGRIYFVEAYKGTASTDKLAWRFDASLYTPRQATTFVDAEGRTWTLANGAAITTVAPLLLAMNGSQPGATISYAEDVTRQPILISCPSSLHIFNWGHNEAAVNIQSDYTPLINDVLTAWPLSSVVVNRQNPQHSGATNKLRQDGHQGEIGAMAARLGYGVIDAYAAFDDTGTPDTYIETNNVHPLADGYALWSNAARKTFGLPTV